MKKKITSILSLVLALVLCVGVMTACGAKEDPTTNPSSTTGTNNTTGTTAAKPETTQNTTGTTGSSAEEGSPAQRAIF